MSRHYIRKPRRRLHISTCNGHITIELEKMYTLVPRHVIDQDRLEQIRDAVYTTAIGMIVLSVITLVSLPCWW